MRYVAIVLAGFGCSGSVAAHDFWVQPGVFQTPAQVAVPIIIQVGHGPARQRWAVSVDRVVRFSDITANGLKDRRDELRPDSGAPQDAMLTFLKPGTHILALETTHAESELPSLRFNTYAADEGLLPALEFRNLHKLTDTPGREVYSRRAKTLVEVGPQDGTIQPHVTRPLGMTLEIVPQKNPYQLGPAETLPVQILYEGKPLAKALVKLTNLDFDARPIETHLTDATGHAAFKILHRGKWLLNVIWTKPITGNPKADFETIFSSLTFGFPNQPSKQAPVKVVPVPPSK